MTPPLADTAAVAVAIGRSPGYVRLLVHKGLLQPVGTERVGRGRPRNLFDLRQVRQAIADNPKLSVGS